MTTIGLSYSLVKISTKCAPALLSGERLRVRGEKIAVCLMRYIEQQVE